MFLLRYNLFLHSGHDGLKVVLPLAAASSDDDGGAGAGGGRVFKGARVRAIRRCFVLHGFWAFPRFPLTNYE